VSASRHVVVAGGGVMGAATAYYLARKGLAVTLVERTAVACGASGKSGGFLALDWCDDSELGPLARASFALHAALARDLGTDYGYRRVDTFMAVAREVGRVSEGHRVAVPAWMDGESSVRAVIGSHETTAQLNPAPFTTALAEASGAVVRRGVVQALAVRDGVARGLRVDGETLAADAVVLALGPWTSAVAGRLLPRIRGLKGYSVTLTGLDLPAHSVFMDYRTADGRVLEPEIFPRPGGEVYVCGMRDLQPLPESAEGVEVDDAACDVLARAAGRVCTALTRATIVRRQACYRPVTDDGLPLIGRVPGVAGAYVATGHGPWGMLNAPATGRRSIPRDRRSDGASSARRGAWSTDCSRCPRIHPSARCSTATSGTCRPCAGPTSWASARPGSASTTPRRGSRIPRPISSSPRR
jgi:glycine/D-amino acid oxidase-like deaminating enzyme